MTSNYLTLLKGYLKIDVHSNQSFAVIKYKVSSSSTVWNNYISKHFLQVFYVQGICARARLRATCFYYVC